MKNGLKGLVMLALAYFLFSRITNGTLFFYINNRFAWLTFLAVIGFFAVALGYLYQARLVRQMLDGAEARRLGAPGSTNEEDHPDMRSSHAHGRTDHAHPDAGSPHAHGRTDHAHPDTGSSHAHGRTDHAHPDAGSPHAHGRTDHAHPDAGSPHAHGRTDHVHPDLGSSHAHGRTDHIHPDTGSSHAHVRTDHAHHHDHGLSRIGLALVLLPVVLGLLVPARPLGAAAVGNREVSVGRLSTAAAPRASQVAAPTREKNLLDWLMAFDQAQDPAAFDGQPANLLGFVYRDSRFGDDSFLLSRFVVSCCVADATPVGLVVRTPAASQLALDQWVQVSGRFQAGAFDGHPMPILVADIITPTVAPNQPYLFP